jgi:serine protease Do
MRGAPATSRRPAAALAGVLAAVLLPARPHASPLPGGELQGAIFAARDAVLPALVHVEPIIELYQRGQKAKAAITGSGVIIDAQGHVVTNNHVVENARRVTCVLYDRRERTAKVVGQDSLTDVAVLLLELRPGERVPVAELGRSDALTAGQHVIAMGSPLGLARSISVGVVSTPDRYLPEDFLPSGEITGTYNTWIQTDAAINPGNSGGPLADLTGRVVGINARAVPIFGENLGFAIPINVVWEVAQQLISSGRVTRSWIGVRWQHLKALEGYFGTEGRGVLVGSLVPAGPADRAGLQPGDVLVDWNGHAVSARFEEELPAFRKMVADEPIGVTVPVRVLRRGSEVALQVTTEQHPHADSREAELGAWGLTARDLTQDLARRRRIKDLAGALVTGVKPSAPAAVAGLQEDDIIREVEGTRIHDTQELLEVAQRLQEAKRRQLLVKADRGATIRVVVIETSGT